MGCPRRIISRTTNVKCVQADIVVTSLENTLTGIEVTYHLLHSMEGSKDYWKEFASCACQERVKDNPEINMLYTQPLIDWENSTHYIDNNLCKFMAIEKYEHDTNLKNALKKY